MIFDTTNANFDSFLVKLHDTQKILGLARDKTPESSQKLTSIITEAFQSNLSTHEAEIAADVLIDLVKKMDMHIRRHVAHTLAREEKLPLRLALHIANDDIQVAQEFLEHSPSLQETDLHYIIEANEASHWAAIAKRQDLTNYLIETLADKKDINTAHNLIHNSFIGLTEKAVDCIAQTAMQHEQLIKDFIKRKEVSKELSTELYWKVNQAVRKDLESLSQLVGDFDLKTADRAMEQAAQDFIDMQFEAVLVLGEDQQEAAEMKRRGTLTINKIVETLITQNSLSKFYAQYSAFTGITIQFMDKILRQRSGQGLAVLCRAFETDMSLFAKIYTTIMKALNSGEKSRLYEAIEYYNNLSTPKARAILKKKFQHLNFQA